MISKSLEKTLLELKRNGIQKVLISGGSGLFSSNACHLLSDIFDVSCVSRSVKSFLPNVSYHTSDLSIEENVNGLFKEVCPDLVINAAGMTSVEGCEDNFQVAIRSNVNIAVNFAKQSRLGDIPYIHLSTDHFSNSIKFNSTEDEIEIPKNNYAASKLEAERLVLRENSNAIIGRTNFFGWGHSKRGSFSDFIIKSLENDRELKLFHDVFYSPILVDHLIEDLLNLVLNGEKGIFNIVGSDSLTKYQFGKRLSNFFDFRNPSINLSLLKDQSNLTPRPYDMSLSRAKVDNALGDRKQDRSLSKMFFDLKASRERSIHFENYINSSKEESL